MVRDDARWERNFNVLKDYVEEFGCFPKKDTEYKGVKIHGWLQNQKNFKRKGTLPQNRLDALNNFNPLWNAFEKEKDEWAKNNLINSNWKSNVSEGKTPIDALYQDINNLSRCLKRGIYDCETLLETDKSAAPVYECLSKIYPYLDENYTRLLCSVFCFEPYSNEAKELFESIAANSREEMVSKFDSILDTLTEREQKVLRLRYGLDDGRLRFLEETGRFFDLSRDRIRQIEAKALRKLRHPYRRIKLFMTNTILDVCPNAKKLHPVTKGNLYRLGITTEEKLVEYIKSDISDNLRIEISEWLDELNMPNEMKAFNNVPILLSDITKMSVRAYNCLRRAGFKTLEDVSKVSIDDLMKVRHLGRHTLDEILGILEHYGYKISDESETETDL